MSSETPWCLTCCTRHDLVPTCPGELLATGPERYGWKGSVLIGRRVETYGVLIAEAGEIWRSRILTFPNMLWSVPGGRGTMKFLGTTAQEAETHAREFIQERCRIKGLEIGESPADVQSQMPAREAREDSPHGSRHPRFMRNCPVRFGKERATEAATTADLSEGGLFISTQHPLARGTRVKLMLELEHFTVPLTGVVSWVRLRTEGSRPSGMGVELTARPAIYTRYVRKLS